uniref:Radiation-inducible immediate-early gene IEX-1 n=1 Tax=Hippocampus comes TaxID=109280 RepID=A0A3Q2Y116_HIPCM
MYSTNSTMLLYRRESLVRRNTRPEVFTFEHIPTAASSTKAPARPKKRCTRVMYPARVRMHLPPPEKSAVKRWLLLLVLVLLWQIYTEDPGSPDDDQAFPAGGDASSLAATTSKEPLRVPGPPSTEQGPLCPPKYVDIDASFVCVACWH